MREGSREDRLGRRQGLEGGARFGEIGVEGEGFFEGGAGGGEVVAFLGDQAEAPVDVRVRRVAWPGREGEAALE